MSTSGPRYHIPFPKNFLSLNARPSKATDAATPESAALPHGFLSNRPAVPRHFSISSASSTGSNSSVPDSPPTQTADSSVLKQAMPAFLALNSKFVAPHTSDKGSGMDKSSFLSNRR